MTRLLPSITLSAGNSTRANSANDGTKSVESTTPVATWPWGVTPGQLTLAKVDPTALDYWTLKQRVAERCERDGARAVAVVEIAARVRDFRVRRREVEEADDRTHGRFVREISDAEKRAAIRVVLLRHDGRACAIGRDGDAGEIIRNTRRTVATVKRAGSGQSDRPHEHKRGV